MLAVAIVIIDLMVFVLPLTALATAYVIIARPKWFANFFILLYKEKGEGR
jgi:hypothetical protein